MGFHFTDTEESTGPIRVETLHTLQCKACPLNNAKVVHPKMEPTGCSEPIIYVLGEAPGKTEDEEGVQFVGTSGRLLREELTSALGLSDTSELEDFVRFNNCIRTRPPKNRDPEWVEIECCRPSVEQDIERTKPLSIFGFGGVPLRWITGKTDAKISAWRGRRIPVQIGNHKCWYFPFHHPAFVGRKGGSHGKSDEWRIFVRDLSRAVSSLDGGLPELRIISKSEAFKGIRCYTGSKKTDLRFLLRALEQFRKYPTVGFDIETHSDEPKKGKRSHRQFRPFGKGTLILTAAISNGLETVAFAIDHPGAGWSPEDKKVVHKAFKKFMLNPEQRKVCHNATFEIEWCCDKYGKELAHGTLWGDTQAQAYVLDTREGVLSLDDLTYLRFGFSVKNLSSINISNLINDDVGDVCRYNALDAKWTYHLSGVQTSDVINSDLAHVYFDQISRIPTIVLSQVNGVLIDFEATKRWEKILTEGIEDSIKEMYTYDEVHDYIEEYGDYNPSSQPYAGRLMHEFFKFEDVRTERGYNIDKENLAKINHPFAQLHSKYLSMKSKLSNNIIGYFPDKEDLIYPDNLLHTQYGTMTARTRRLAARYPNVQNYAKHDPIFYQMREQFIAPPGHRIVCFDYGQHEFRVFGMASKDKSLCQVLKERYDVHGEWADRIVSEYPKVVGTRKAYKDPAVKKDMRYRAKNKFVFPTCFGAQPFSISRDLGIPEYLAEDFQDEFFKMFPDLKEWQIETKKFYDKYGYVELLTGFRRHGPLGWNEIINTPIQGTASDIVVDSMNHISKLGHDEGRPHLQPPLEIHDDLTFYLPEESLDEDISDILDIMLTHRYNFINVPLAVEVSEGSNWYNQEHIGDFFSDAY